MMSRRGMAGVGTWYKRARRMGGSGDSTMRYCA